MNILSRLVVTAAVVGGVGAGTPARASSGETPRAQVARTADRPATGGSIVSFVRDHDGKPVRDAVVSVVGRRIATGVTDQTGKCTFVSLPPGDYLVRVHRPGYVSASSLLVIAAPGVGTAWSFVLKQQPSAFLEPVEKDQARPVYAAGFVGEEPTLRPAGSASSDEGDDDHGEVAWRIRHLKRSVLQDATEQAPIDDGTGDGTAEFDPNAAATFARPSGDIVTRFATTLLSGDFPLVGQLNLLTTGAFDSPQQLISAGTLARGVAQMSIGSSAGRHGDWSVQGAMTQGDVAAWMVSGSYLTRAPARHVYDAGMSYSLQRYDGSNPAALAAMADGNRYAAVLYAFDAWTISRKVTVLYGGRYAKYGYLEDSLFSPRARLTIAPTGTLRLSFGASRRAVAPGAEEFVPSMVAGTWVPPERTFAPITGTSFVPERTSHYDVGLEHDLSPTTVVAVRGFYQDTEDQLVTLFGLGNVERPAADLGHYFVGSAGDVAVHGWTVSVRQIIADRVRGSVDYTVSTSDWQDTPQSEIVSLRLPGVARRGSERIQGVTAAVDTDIPVTETHVYALYRVSTGYAGGTIESLGPTLAARFDVQVTQSLPFMDFANAHWEMLVGVRNLFRDAADEASIYDELLVVRPPKRIVGGLTLRF
jgi:hypothetical protein